MEDDSSSFFFTVVLSSLFHIAVILGLIFAPAYTPAKRFSPSSVINVSMVMLSPKGDDTESKDTMTPAEEPESVEEVSVEPEELEQEELSVEPEELDKESLIEPDTPEVEAEQAPEKPMVEPEKPVETLPVIAPLPPKEKVAKIKPETPVQVKPEKVSVPEKTIKYKKPDKQVINKKKERVQQVSAAINRLKKKHQNSDHAKETQKYEKDKETGTPGGSGKDNGQGSSGGTGNRGFGSQYSAAVRFYRDHVIPGRINRNWALSEHLLERRFGLQALVVIKIMPNGHIRDMWFEKRSGDRYFDDSVRRAVMKSNPLPPLPNGFSGTYEVELVFTPAGLN